MLHFNSHRKRIGSLVALTLLAPSSEYVRQQKKIRRNFNMLCVI